MSDEFKGNGGQQQPEVKSMAEREAELRDAQKHGGAQQHGEPAQPQGQQATPSYGAAQQQYGGQQGQQAPPYGNAQQYGQQGQPQYGYYQEPPMTGILEAYKSYWRNYVNFNDRTSRAGYWWVALINCIISIILYAVVIMPFASAALMGSLDADSYGIGTGLAVGGVAIIYWLWELVNLLPQLAITVRRLHDTGKCWAWILLGLIPFVGSIILIIFLAVPTDYSPTNRFFHLPRQA